MFNRPQSEPENPRTSHPPLEDRTLAASPYSFIHCGAAYDLIGHGAITEYLLLNPELSAKEWSRGLRRDLV